MKYTVDEQDEPETPEGYRELDVGEVIREDDMFWHAGAKRWELFDGAYSCYVGKFRGPSWARIATPLFATLSVAEPDKII
jgi:hypothetical protein